MAYIVEHCRLDVLVLEEVYQRLRPLILDHPIMRARGVCRCGSKRVRYGGYHRTTARVYRRFQCLECGKWDHEKTPVQTVGAGQMARRQRTRPNHDRRRR
jgi:hypothetical protein